MTLPPGVRVFERGWLSANNVLLVDEDCAALVDTGYWTHSAQTVSLVEGALGTRPLDLVLNTHLHSDHCGGNAVLQGRYPELAIGIPPGLAAAVRAWDPVALTYGPTGQHCPPFNVDRTLAPGSQLRLAGCEWQVHAAPGHDPHSVIFFEPSSRTLLSADALWQNGFGVVFPELEGEQAFTEVARTLDLIERLAPSLVVPGHGSPFEDIASALMNARRRLDAYVRDPVRHAAHAAKVLIKFKLLEVQQVDRLELLAWALETSYFRLVHERYFEGQQLQDWFEDLVGELVRAGAARVTDHVILNA